jgi:hypothetical protein
MEASGFFATASRFSSLELIQSFKVISDNRLSPITSLNGKILAKLIENQLATIHSLKSELEHIRQQPLVDANETIDSFQTRWNFTTHQLTQLKALLSQWKTLSADTVPTAQTLAQLNSSRHVIGWLKTEVSTLPIQF